MADIKIDDTVDITDVVFNVTSILQFSFRMSIIQYVS